MSLKLIVKRYPKVLKSAIRLFNIKINNYTDDLYRRPRSQQ